GFEGCRFRLWSGSVARHDAHGNRLTLVTTAENLDIPVLVALSGSCVASRRRDVSRRRDAATGTLPDGGGGVVTTSAFGAGAGAGGTAGCLTGAPLLAGSGSG